MADVTIVNKAEGTITWFIYNADDKVEVIALNSGTLGQGKTAGPMDVKGDGTGFVVNIHYNQEQKKFTLPDSGGTVTYPS
jgi:hypothetical protein